jgi:cyclophilin family peptidyl-prolyl cis-trans isomerase
VRSPKSEDGNTETDKHDRTAQSYSLDESPLPSEHEVTDRVKITTSKGVIIVGLYGKDAPKTVNNFLKYVDKGFYSNLIFHRVIEGFMIQGGGFDSGLKRAPTDSPIELEIIPGLKHEVGTLSMARTSDPHSATSQFFICVGVAPQLNGSYAAFGKAEEGEDVLRSISQVPTETLDTVAGPMEDVPIDSVIIESISRL